MEYDNMEKTIGITSHTSPNKFYRKKWVPYIYIYIWS